VEIAVDAATRTAAITGSFVEGFQPPNETNLSFIREVTGSPALASRIGKIDLFDHAGKSVEVRKLMDGEYVAAGVYRSWKYSVDLTQPKNRAGYAHVSWIGDSSGVLMLDDLLPQYGTRTGRLPGVIELKLPEDWNIHSSDAPSLSSDDLPTGVVFIGKGHRVVDVKADAGDVKLVLTSEWHFTDVEAAQMAREIFDEYSRLLGNLPQQKFLISIQRFPGQESPGHWEAETRGRTVTIMSSDMPFRTQSLQRLHEQLRHEIFHLWFPNGINLFGDYAWFYEGFAMYSSLKLAVKLNRIRFEDFLDTLGRAHTIDSNSRPRKALTDPTIDPTVRYARGMMVAFLTDLEILRNSNGKRDVGSSLRQLFDQPRLPHGALAGDAVRTVVTNQNVFQRYVEGSEQVDWASDLVSAGIESKPTGRSTTLSVAAKPSGRQKEILDRLGYNNWRKIGTKK